jgi:AraC family transcriptional regulator, positive regulator of tynA and feaB
MVVTKAEAPVGQTRPSLRSRLDLTIVRQRVQSRSAVQALLIGSEPRSDMKTLFSTIDVRPQDRFDFWHAAARQYLIEHDARVDCRLNFEAKLCAGELGGLNLVSFQTSSMSFSHTSRHAAQETSDELFVCRQLAGSLDLEQDQLRVALKPGDLALLDPRLPYSGKFSPDSGLLVVKVPRQRLEARIGRTHGVIARRIGRESEDNGLLSDFLALLPSHAEQLDLTAAMVAEQALDLLAVALAKASGLCGPRISSARLLVLTRLRSVIQANLTDPALSPSAVAAAVGVSVRYANAVLAGENTSVARFIQTCRLERCRQALADVTQAHRLVSDIAYGWGFSDMTHFGRRFKAAYGMLPTEYRKNHLLCPDRSGADGAL